MLPLRFPWPRAWRLATLGGAGAALLWALTSAQTRQALRQSALLAGATVAVAVPLGTLLAVLLVRVALPGRRMAGLLLVLLMLTPLHVHLAGWEAALGKLGWLTLLRGRLDQPLLAGMTGAIVVHAAAAVPWVAVLVAVGLLHLPASPEEHAWTVVPPHAVLTRITLPQVRPLVLLAVLWTALATTSDMTVTNVYLIRPAEQTVTERFYMTFAMAGEPGAALRGALPALAVGVLTVGAVLRVALPTVLRRCTLPGVPLAFPPGRFWWLWAGVLWVIVGVLVFVPLASLVIKAGQSVELVEGERQRAWSALTCLERVALAPWHFAREWQDTLKVAGSAAAAAVAAGLWLGWQWRRGGWRAWMGWCVTLLALVTPGPLVGVALIALFNHDLPPALPWVEGGKSWLLWIYDDTLLLPLLAQAWRALPWTSLLLGYSFASLPGNLLAAAALDRLSPPAVFWRVAMPMRWRAVVAAGLVALALAAGDLAWSHLVTPPGIDLLQRRVFGLLHAGVEEQVAAVALVQSALYAMISVAVMRLMHPARSTWGGVYSRVQPSNDYE